jgi:aspartyl-tRNA(Asn)/glutamyl-tRNA(Gln) amidotransferase subunit A
MVTTCGLAARRSAVADADAEVIGRLRRAGMVFLGKANMHEAAMGGTTDNPTFGRCHNPLRPGYTAGGSSGGSAAAIAAGICPVSLGTDTLGSTRIPAAYCGLVGLKPTRNLISTVGVVPLSLWLDHVGLIGRSIDDVALLLDAAASERGAAAVWPRAPRRTEWRRPMIGLLRNAAAIKIEPAAAAAFATAVAALRSAGNPMLEIEVAEFEPEKARRYGVLCGEADAVTTYAMILDTCPETLSDETRSLLEFGRKATAAKLAIAYHYLERFAQHFRRLFDDVDIVLTPTTPQAAFPFSGAAPATQGDFTALANFAGLPALTIPFGRSDDSLPLGLQLIAPAGSDHQLLHFGRRCAAILARTALA